jgi:hypothetical protein
MNAGTVVYLESFISGIVFPTTAWNAIKANWTMPYMQCNKTNCGFKGACASHIGDFFYLAVTFGQGTKAYQVSPKSYLVDTLDAKNESWCAV